MDFATIHHTAGEEKLQPGAAESTPTPGETPDVARRMARKTGGGRKCNLGLFATPEEKHVGAALFLFEKGSGALFSCFKGHWKRKQRRIFFTSLRQFGFPGVESDSWAPKVMHSMHARFH